MHVDGSVFKLRELYKFKMGFVHFQLGQNTQENVDILNTELSVETSKNAPDVEQRILLREDKRCSQNKRTVSMKVDPSL